MAQTYQGSACGTCGFARRYASNRKCVNCNTAGAYIVVKGSTDIAQLTCADLLDVHRHHDAALEAARKVDGRVLRCSALPC